MATVKISDLPSVEALQDTDFLVLDQVDKTRKVNLGNFKDKLNLVTEDRLNSDIGSTLIGYVPDFATLRTIIPNQAGLRITLGAHTLSPGWSAAMEAPLGGGEFISMSGSATDDGGHIAVVNSSWYWVRDTEEVKLTDYNVKTFSWNSANVTVANDQSDKVNAACARAVFTGYPLIAPPASYNGSLRGIPVLKTINITNVRSIKGDLLLFANNLLGSYSEVSGVTNSTGVSQKFVLTNMNADFDSSGGYVFSSVKGPRSYGVLRVINLGDRSTRLNGQLHFVASTTYDGVFSEGFNGWGIHWGISQDTVVKHQSTSRCGNINQYALYAYSYPRATSTGSDFCNNLTFESVICEYSTERSIFLAGPDVRYTRIHEEGTHVTGAIPDSWGVYTIDSYATGIGSGIANCAFALNNGSGAQLNVIDLDGTNETNMNLVLNMAHADFGLVQATRTSSDKTYLTNTIVAPGWSGDGGNIGEIRTDQLHTQDTVSVINKVSASLANIRSPSIQILGAAITKLNLYSGTVHGYTGSSSGWVNLGGSTYTARIVNSTILNGNIYLDTSSSSDMEISNCLIAGTITRGRYDGSTVTASGTRPTRFNAVTFTGPHDLSTSGAMVEYSDCYFTNLVHAAKTYYQIHKGSRIATYNKTSGAYGLWAFDEATTIRSMSGDWAWPDTSYDNLGAIVCNPLNGRKRKWTPSGWMAYEGPFTTSTISLAAIPAGSTVSTTVALTGAVLGDTLVASVDVATSGILISAEVNTANMATVFFYNTTSGALDLSGTLKVKVV